MSLTRSSVWLRYGLVPVIVAIAFLLRWPLWQVLGPDMPFLFFWPAVVVCAAWGGLGPGLLATLLSALACRWFWWQVYLWQTEKVIDLDAPRLWTALGLFVGLGVFTTLLLEWLHFTQRRAARSAAKFLRQRDWLRATLAGIGDGVIATDTSEMVTFLNPAACALTGWSPENAVGEHLGNVFQIINDKTRHPAESPINRVLRDGKVPGLVRHLILVSRDGMERPIEDSAAPVRDDSGQVVGAVLVFREVSPHRQREKEPHPLAARRNEPAALTDTPAEAHPVSLRLRVLVIEDDRPSAESLGMLLEMMGHEVEIAYSGPEGVKKAAAFHPHLVLSDIGLPGMDGNTVASTLRRQPATARARLIALSGRGSEEDRRRALEAGFDHHLTKPVDPQVLQTVLALQTLVAHADQSSTPDTNKT